MRLKGLNCVAIINLSDLRAGNINDFMILLEKVWLAGFYSYSFLLQDRKNDLASILNSCRGPILTA